MNDFNSIVRAQEIVSRLSFLTTELNDIIKNQPLLEEYAASITSSINDDLSILNNRLELTIITELISNVNDHIQPNFKFDIEATNKKLTLESNPEIYNNGDKSNLALNVVVNSNNPVVVNTLIPVLSVLGCERPLLLQLHNLIMRWYPDNFILNSDTDENIVTEVINPEPVDEDLVHQTKPTVQPEEDDKEEESHEEESTQTSPVIQPMSETTEEETPEVLEAGTSEDSKFKKFVKTYLSDHNTFREFKLLKTMVERELHAQPLTRSETISRVTEKAVKAGMNSDDEHSKLLLELAVEVIARNYVLEGKNSFLVETETEDLDSDDIVISSAQQPILTYLLLMHDVVNSKLVSNRPLLEVVYHMFEFDKYKNILSSQNNVIGFHGAVRMVTAIFSRHNWKLNFYENTVEILNPLLPLDVWTKEIDDVGGFISRIQSNVVRITDLEKLVKMRDLPHDYSNMKEVAQLALDDSPDFIDRLKQHVNELLDNDISIAITTERIGFITSKVSTVLINRDKNRALLVLPNNVYAMTVKNNQVIAVTIIGQYNLTELFEWLTYFELNYEV